MNEIFKEYKQNKTKNKIEVSKEGSLKVNGKLYVPKFWGQRYLSYCGMYIHRMIAETFLENPKGLPYVDHIDGNRYNNNLNNLRWCTPSENRLNPITVKRYNKTSKTEDAHNRRVKSHEGQTNGCKCLTDGYVNIWEIPDNWGELIDIGFFFRKYSKSEPIIKEQEYYCLIKKK